MATTHSPHGNSTNHSVNDTAKCNETMLLVEQLEQLGWSRAKLAETFSETAGIVHDWSRGRKPATDAQRTQMRTLVKAEKKLAKAVGKRKKAEPNARAAHYEKTGEFDHSPKTPEEKAAEEAERDALMAASGTTLTPPRAPASAKKASKEPNADTRVITVLVKANPKKTGSAAHTRFALYRNGMTVEEFLKAGGTSGDVAWDARHKFIELK